MPLKWNGNVVSNLKWNGNDVTTFKFNGTEVPVGASTKTWVYQGTTGTYDYTTTHDPVSLCKLFTSSAAYSWLENVKPAENESVGYQARVRAFDTATPLPNDCGYHYFEVELA